VVRKFAENDTLYIEESYAHGVLQGIVLIYYPEGMIYRRMHFVDGVENGLYTAWYSRGDKALEGRVKNGRREGPWMGWDRDGALVSRYTFVSDVLQGVCTDWYPNGRIRSTGYWDHGKRHGDWKHWNAEGVLEREETWRHGELLKTGGEQP